MRVPRARMAALRAAERSNRQIVDAMAEVDIRALLPLFDQAKSELAGRMRDWIVRHPADGELRWTAQSYRNALHAIEEIEARVRLRTADTALGRLGQLLRAGIRSVSRQLEDLLGLSSTRRTLALLEKEFTGSIHAVAVREAAVIATGQSLLTRRFRTSAARYAGNIRRDLQQRLAVDVLAGAPLRDTIARLVQHGGPRGLVALRGVAGEPGAMVEYIAEGLFRRYPHWADRWVRTEYAGAFNTTQTLASRDIADQLGPGTVTRVWIAAPRCCREICYHLDGTTCDAHGHFTSPEIGQLEAPPAHPYCRCTTAVESVAWDRVDWSRFREANPRLSL